MKPCAILAAVLCAAAGWAATPIDREAVVGRHHVVLTNAHPNTALQVGNGRFAFGMDPTGLQTLYGNTMSHWGWHTAPMPPGMKAGDFRMEMWDTHGRPVGYATSAKGQEALYAWLRENPHRMNLGRLRLLLDGKPVTAVQLSDICQELDPWRGEVESRFRLAGVEVTTLTCAVPEPDGVAVRIASPLMVEGRLAVELAFPYGHHGASGADWARPDAHRTVAASRGARRTDFARTLDGDRYAASLTWSEGARLDGAGPHTWVLAPARGGGALEFVWALAPEGMPDGLPDFGKARAANARHWDAFWRSGGAIDLSGSRDPRWRELERRVVLSQYLLAAQEAGSLPPQESGLFNNGWNGKFHLEMHWWHAAHYALWDRWPMFERSLGWYSDVLPSARERAVQQGYRGARWPKMVGPEGRDSPSGVGPLLIWQQPHPIFYANLDRRLHPGRATLEKWRDIVFESAEFMASFATWDTNTERYVLGPPLKTVPENTQATTAYNPAFELSYWRFGLRIAQEWREGLGLGREPGWDKVLHGLAELPQSDGVYLQQGGMTNTYTTWNWEHPSLVGPLGFLPGDGADPAVARATVRKTMATWQLDRKTWGWDFPLLAMGAARCGEPELAVDALLHPAARNRFNDAGLSEGGPFPYFPSNGGLLWAVAMMAAGWDGAPDRPAPGFPSDGSWTVRWEGLKRAP